MKRYSYNLFPVSLVILGYVLIIIAFIGLYIRYFSTLNDNSNRDISYIIAFIVIGIVIITFKSKILVVKDSNLINKESYMIGLRLSKEKVKIPNNCQGLIIKQKLKIGTRYFSVLPMDYKVKSCDMFFYSEKGVVRLINTDYKRAIIIAELIKENLKIDYKIE